MFLKYWYKSIFENFNMNQYIHILKEKLIQGRKGTHILFSIFMYVYENNPNFVIIIYPEYDNSSRNYYLKEYEWQKYEHIININNDNEFFRKINKKLKNLNTMEIIYIDHCVTKIDDIDKYYQDGLFCCKSRRLTSIFKINTYDMMVEPKENTVVKTRLFDQYIKVLSILIKIINVYTSNVIQDIIYLSLYTNHSITHNIFNLMNDQLPHIKTFASFSHQIKLYIKKELTDYRSGYCENKYFLYQFEV